VYNIVIVYKHTRLTPPYYRTLSCRFNCHCSKSTLL